MRGMTKVCGFVITELAAGAGPAAAAAPGGGGGGMDE